MAKVKFNIGGVIIEMEQEEVSKAIEAGEVTIQSDELVTYKKDQFETFKTNLANDEYKKGKTAGVEMTIKDAREKHGLEFEGKTFDSFTEAFKTKILTDAKIEPTKKIQELETEKKQLQENYKTLESEYTGFKTTISEKETRSNKDAKLLSFIPATGLKVSQDIALMALKMKGGIDAAFDESNVMFITENGQAVKDSKTLEYGDPKQHILDKLTALDLIEKSEGGKGEKDEIGKGQASNYDKFVKEMETNGISEGSEKFGEELNKRVGNKTLVM